MQETTSFWNFARQHLQTMTTPEMYKSWIAPLQIDQIQEDSILFRTPSSFFTSFIKSNFEQKIVNAISMATGKSFRILYTHEPPTPPVASDKNVIDLLGNYKPASQNNEGTTSNFQQETPTYPQEKPVAESFVPPEGSDVSSIYFKSNNGNKGLIKCTSEYIDSSHSFNTFIVSGGTQFAHAAAKAAASFPGGKYNPLLIYGPSGLGKTHLLHAIALEMLKNNPSARICYISAEQFVNEFIEALKNKSTNLFHSKYRSGFDAFLIDDMQYIGGKERSEEEFFHTINRLFASHNQVVLTSDKQPKDLHGFEERLISRLQQGLVVDVKPPDLETRIAILKAKAESEDLYVPDDVCLMIAGHIRNNVRELEGALIRLSAEAFINRSEITLDMARDALSDILAENKSSNLSIESINKCVCQYFKITLAELNSKSRERKYSEPRQIAMFLVRNYTKKTLPEIALAYGGKDHSTVIHAIKKIHREMHTSPTLKKYVEDIKQML